MPINLRRMTLSAFIAMLMVSMIFQNVAAEYYICTVEDNDYNITLNSEDELIVSIKDYFGVEYYYNSSNPSVLNLIDEGIWGGTGILPPGAPVLHNWTFEGAEIGTTTLKFYAWQPWEGNESIQKLLVLNVTSNTNRAMNSTLIIIIFLVIIVVPSAIIIKWMRREKNEN